MTKTALSMEKLTQSQVQAQISGPVVELPAGLLQVAVLGSYRRNTYRFTPDSDLVTQNIEAVTGSAPARGNINLKEIAGQVDIPLISGAEFAEELAIGAAARYSDYSTTGSVTSYEGDMRWKPVDALMLRGSYQRAVRAPNIGELFSPPTGTQVQFSTPPASVWAIPATYAPSPAPGRVAPRSARFASRRVCPPTPSTPTPSRRRPQAAPSAEIWA